MNLQNIEKRLDKEEIDLPGFGKKIYLHNIIFFLFIHESNT